MRSTEAEIMSVNYNTTRSVFDHSLYHLLNNVTTFANNRSLNGSDLNEDQPQSFTDPGLEMTRFIVQRTLVPLVTSVGVVGNIISISVLTQRSMVSSTHCYLTTLSVFDLLYLLFSFTLSLKHYPSVKGQSAYTYWFPYGRVFTDICSNVSVVLTVTFSLERLIAVCYPMKGRVICTPERARIITTFVTLAAIGCTAPEFFEFDTKEVLVNGELIVKNTESELAERPSYKVGYQSFIGITFTILPLFLLIVFNGLLIRSVLMATRLRREMTTYVSVQHDSRRRQGDQNHITVMLIAVVVVFLVCQTPNAILLLYRSFVDVKGIELTFSQTVNLIISANVVNLLIQINASINFVLYSVMSTKFRRVFCRLFCRFLDKYKYTMAGNGTEMTYFQSVSMGTQNMSIHAREHRRRTSMFSHGGGGGYESREVNRFIQHNQSPDYCEKVSLMHRQSKQHNISCSSSSNSSDREPPNRAVSACAVPHNKDKRSVDRKLHRPANGLSFCENGDRRKLTFVSKQEGDKICPATTDTDRNGYMFTSGTGKSMLSKDNCGSSLKQHNSILK